MPICVIETDRLNIGLLKPDEYQLLQQYLSRNKTHLAKWEPTRDPIYYTQYEITLRIKSALLAFKQQSAFHFVLLNKNNDKVLGVCNFANAVRGPLQACHLGYALCHEYQGQGLMQEALRAATSYVFETLKFHRIIANYIPDNKRSENTLTKAGFEREGYAKSYLKIAGKWQDHVLTAMVNPNEL
ncbi:MAG: ribosomal protein S5-alanine N-acetyltransferase [Oceanospirillaceae bacterium]|nr:ribosomal protein S5-alanine N-acetyltransferase [Oceanospirillaceae bacterium]